MVQEALVNDFRFRSLRATAWIATLHRPLPALRCGMNNLATGSRCGVATLAACWLKSMLGPFPGASRAAGSLIFVCGMSPETAKPLRFILASAISFAACGSLPLQSKGA